MACKRNVKVAQGYIVCNMYIVQLDTVHDETGSARLLSSQHLKPIHSTAAFSLD